MKNLIFFSVFFGSFMLAALSAKAQYTCYIVYSYNNAGYRTQSNFQCYTSPLPNTPPFSPVFRKVNGTGAGNDTTIANTCSLHPNPSNGRFTTVLQYPVSNADIYITDIKGAVIMRKKMDGIETDFDITKYPPGVYVMHLKSSDYEFEAKVVKE